MEFGYTLSTLTHICTTELSQSGKLMGDLGENLHQHLGDSPGKTVLALGQDKKLQEWRGLNVKDNIHLDPIAVFCLLLFRK